MGWGEWIRSETSHSLQVGMELWSYACLPHPRMTVLSTLLTFQQMLNTIYLSPSSQSPKAQGEIVLCICKCFISCSGPNSEAAKLSGDKCLRASCGNKPNPILASCGMWILQMLCCHLLTIRGNDTPVQQRRCLARKKIYFSL